MLRPHNTLRAACLLTLVGVLAACGANPAVPLVESRDFLVADVQGVCQGRASALAVDLTVQGYDLREILQGDSNFGLGGARLPESDLRLEPNVFVDVDSVPDGAEHLVRLVKPLDSGSGLTAGQTATVDVRTGRDGAVTDAFRAIRVTIPTCS